MQTLTFTQKLLRQRRFLSSLIPLLALFLGLGASQKALAINTPSNSTIFISRNGAANETFDAKSGAPTPFNGARLGTYDINNGRLILNGGSITSTLTNSSTATSAELSYTVTDSLDAFIKDGIIALSMVVVSGNVRTFSFATANVNLLDGISGAASGYKVSVEFLIRGANPANTRDDNFGNLYIAKFNVTGTRPVPNGVTFSNPTVIVDQGSGTANSYTASVFNGTTLVDEQTGSTATPAFDINDGKLILKGGGITTTETGNRVVNGAFLDYIVYAPNGNVLTDGMLQLVQQNTTVTGGVRDFLLTTGPTNVIPLSLTAGTNYAISVSYHATYRDNGVITNPPLRVNYNNNGLGFNGKYDVDGIKTPAPTVQANTITLDPNGVPPATTPPAPPAPANVLVVYNINPNVPRPFQNADLSATANSGSSYDVNSGQLLLNNTSVTTTQAGPNSIISVILYYRTRLSGTAGGAYEPITLTQSGATTPGGQKTFVIDPTSPINTISQPNLIATPAVIGAGTYNVDVYYQANGFNSATGTPFSITDPPTANDAYTATFTVTGSPNQTTIWTGGKNDNWFDVANWSAGLPSQTKSALVRDLGAGNAVPYPNINANVQVFAPNGGPLLYDNTTSGPAKTLDLTMGGSSQAARSIARLVKGRLIVYGDFNNDLDSFIQRDGTTIEFGGVNQLITGGSFVEVDITGGGNKRSTGLFGVTKAINFTSGLLTTDISKPLVSVIQLSDRAPINNENGAQLVGENDLTYLRGFVTTSREGVVVGETRTFGNMGMQLTFTGTVNPGNVKVTRNTVESYTPIANRHSIRRIFGVRPGVASTTVGNVTTNTEATMVFRYRDSETMNLGGACNACTEGTKSIQEQNLIIFISQNSGNTFGIVGRDGLVDTNNNIVTKSGVRNFATFTLGDSENPLPVRLTAFGAKRVGTDALVTWETASEQNSRGYEVQVSTTGKEFRTLASVASAAPTTNRTTQYRYIDTEANKSGIRYYRLRQIDLDGKEAFFSPVAVSFTGKAIETALVAYPNPLNGNEQLHLTFQSAKAGKGQISITDMTGRMVRQQSIDVTTGTSDLTVEKLGDLKMGMYLVRLTLPSGQVQNLKVVKQ